MEKVIFRPQKGKQEKFLASSADICIYGGAAGGGNIPFVFYGSLNAQGKALGHLF